MVTSSQNVTLMLLKRFRDAPQSVIFLALEITTTFSDKPHYVYLDLKLDVSKTTSFVLQNTFGNAKICSQDFFEF